MTTPAAGEELADLHDRQAVLLEPHLDLVMVGHQQPPPLTTPIATMRSHGLHHRPDELIRQLAVAAVTHQAQTGRCVDVTADRLAVHPRQLGRLAQTFTAQPQPQHFSNLVHTNLPEHRHLSSIPLIGGGEFTGNSTAAGGPCEVVPSLAKQWSHPPGGTHLKVVPCSWRATLSVGGEPSVDRCRGAATRLSPSRGPRAMRSARDTGRVAARRSRARLRPVDAAAITADYEAGTTVDAICAAHRIGLSRLYRILDEHHVQRRRTNSERTPEHVQQKIVDDYQIGRSIH